MHPPTDSEVVVRFARTDPFDNPALAAQALALLGPEERAACARLRPPGARRDYLAAHAVTRMLLAELVGGGTRPWDLRFRRSPWGRPELVEPARAEGLSFSISHSSGVAVCAAAWGRPIGADVECLEHLGLDPGIESAVCSPAERDELRASPRSARRRRLLELWTRKEAVLKGTGFGLYLRPRDVDVTRGAATAAGVLWGLVGWPLPPNHLAALAVGGAAGDLVTVRVEEAHFRVGGSASRALVATARESGSGIA